MLRAIAICMMFAVVVSQSGQSWAEVVEYSELQSAAAKKAIEEYLARIDEIERVAAEQKAQARQQLMQALSQTGQFQPPSGPRYRGMLGSYFNQQGRIPFIMLSVPSGENTFGEHARSVFNGRYDMSKPLTSFQARGHVAIPKSGDYRLEANPGYGDFKLNDLGYALGTSAPDNRYSADVELAEGVYYVFYSVANNGGQLPGALIRIIDRTTQQELPIFIYESELRGFSGNLSLGVPLIETSKWTPEENKLEDSLPVKQLQ